ncbi:MAG: hypothetical protein KF847_19960 [Pirellulales bacterium]|nr:hypothetical protein [Pirellulales bacterium]
MPSIGRRPVTWLFFAATAVVTATIVFTLELPTADRRAANVPNMLLCAVLLGPIYLSGAAVAAWRAHRLLRLGLFAGGTALFPTLLTFSGDWSRWSRYVGGVFLMQVLAALGAATLVLGRRLLGDRSRGENGPWQFPLIELFGWSIVVAIVSACLRNSPVGELLGSHDAVAWLTVAYVAGFALAWRLARPDPPQARFAAVVAGGILAVAIVSVNLLQRRSDATLMCASIGWCIAWAGCLAVDSWNDDRLAPKDRSAHEKSDAEASPSPLQVDAAE